MPPAAIGTTPSPLLATTSAVKLISAAARKTSPGQLLHAYINLHATGREQSSRYNDARGCCRPSFARRCRTEPTSSHSERRSSSSLAPPPAKQVLGSFSMLTATCMQRGESRAAVMMVQGGQDWQKLANLTP